jgi:hypothetical protein
LFKQVEPIFGLGTFLEGYLSFGQKLLFSVYLPAAPVLDIGKKKKPPGKRR